MTDVGGDPACWLDRVCEHCGQIVGDGEDHDCVADGPRPDVAEEMTGR